MILVLELEFQASSQLWNPLIIEGPNTMHNPLSHTHRNSRECWKNEKKNPNELSVGAGASSIQPTLELTRYRGLHTKLNPLSHTNRNSLEYWEN
jgi:hypothetical protein